MKIEQIKDNLNLPNDYKITIDDASRAVVVQKGSVKCYLEVDFYDPKQTLEVTDAGITFDGFIFPNQDKDLKVEVFSNNGLTKLNNNQKQQIINILNKANLGILENFNEIVQDTSLKNESKDVVNLLTTLSKLEELKQSWKK